VKRRTAETKTPIISGGHRRLGATPKHPRTHPGAHVGFDHRRIGMTHRGAKTRPSAPPWTAPRWLCLAQITVGGNPGVDAAAAGGSRRQDRRHETDGDVATMSRASHH